VRVARPGTLNALPAHRDEKAPPACGNGITCPRSNHSPLRSGGFACRVLRIAESVAVCDFITSPSHPVVPAVLSSLLHPLASHPFAGSMLYLVNAKTHPSRAPFRQCVHTHPPNNKNLGVFCPQCDARGIDNNSNKNTHTHTHTTEVVVSPDRKHQRWLRFRPNSTSLFGLYPLFSFCFFFHSARSPIPKTSPKQNKLGVPRPFLKKQQEILDKKISDETAGKRLREKFMCVCLRERRMSYDCACDASSPFPFWTDVFHRIYHVMS